MNEEIVRFFWERFHRAMQLDAVNKLLGKPTHYWLASEEWTDAYKATLKDKDKKSFEYHWKKLEDALDAYNNATPKQLATMKSPFRTFG